MEGTGVDVPGEAPNKCHELVQIPSPSHGVNSADEHHPEAEDVLQILDIKMSFVAPCARILMAEKSCCGIELKLARSWKLVNKQR